MTDSIPQQAGALAKAIREDGCCHHWKDAVRFLDHLAAPLAVEDSRERCALTDESIDTLLASVGPTQGMRPDSRDLTLAQVRKLVRAAMAAASSGKEKME